MEDCVVLLLRFGGLCGRLCSVVVVEIWGSLEFFLGVFGS